MLEQQSSSCTDTHTHTHTSSIKNLKLDTIRMCRPYKVFELKRQLFAPELSVDLQKFKSAQAAKI